jgi:hypothetical protein
LAGRAVLICRFRAAPSLGDYDARPRGANAAPLPGVHLINFCNSVRNARATQVHKHSVIWSEGIGRGSQVCSGSRQRHFHTTIKHRILRFLPGGRPQIVSRDAWICHGGPILCSRGEWLVLTPFPPMFSTRSNLFRERPIDAGAAEMHCRHDFALVPSDAHRMGYCNWPTPRALNVRFGS